MGGRLDRPANRIFDPLIEPSTLHIASPLQVLPSCALPRPAAQPHNRHALWGNQAPNSPDTSHPSLDYSTNRPHDTYHQGEQSKCRTPSSSKLSPPSWPQKTLSPLHDSGCSLTAASLRSGTAAHTATTSTPETWLSRLWIWPSSEAICCGAASPTPCRGSSLPSARPSRCWLQLY